MPQVLRRDLSAEASRSSIETLRRTCSVLPYVDHSLSSVGNVSTVSGSAHEPSDYRIIGSGSRRTVFEIPQADFAVKKGKDINAMWNDFKLTNAAHNAMADTKELLQDLFSKRTLPKFPQCVELLLPDSKDY